MAIVYDSVSSTANAIPGDAVLQRAKKLKMEDMPNFFDFLVHQGYSPAPVNRLNLRYKHLIEPHRQDLEGARVLDLGSHDGRWPYALAGAGAQSVYGIEGRAESIEKFAAYPAAPFKDRISLKCGDFITEMDRLILQGETFDVIACFGVYYHTMQHYRMMLQMAALKPKLIIIDSLFSRSKKAMIAVARESTEKKGNTIAQFENQKVAPIGHVSLRLMRIMADSVGYSMKKVPWDVPEQYRKPVNDYFSKFEKKVRMTLSLRKSVG